VSLTEAQLLEDIRRLFSPRESNAPRAIGLELELIPVVDSTRQPVFIRADQPPSSEMVLKRLARERGWKEQVNETDPSSWKLDDGTAISFEPGGQIEISTTPHPNASPLIETTRALAAEMTAAMKQDGIDLLALGVDSHNDIAAVPLQLHRDRYTGMTRYFESIGSSGIRMMRQTAALQINVERGEEPESRWRLLNALAPIMVALFANSGDYAGRRSEWASHRAYLWRTLDATRTGIPYDGDDAAADYLRFALDAGAMRSKRGAESGYRSFRDWMRDPMVDEAEWKFHLTTLFPEVRPKDYFEIRSADTIPVASLAAPVVFVAGIIYDRDIAGSVARFLGAPDEGLLERAGKLALNDPEIREVTGQLIELALQGAAKLGEDYIASRHVAEAEEYFRSRLTR
jgi:glutamate--cysteine ligase